MDHLRIPTRLAVLLTLTLGLSPASAQESPEPIYTYALDADRLEVRTGEASEPVADVSLPCMGRSFVRQNSRLYIACGADGLYILSLTDPSAPTPVGMRGLGGTVDDVFVARGTVWAQVARVEALPVERVFAAAPTPVEPLPAEPEQPDDAAEPAEPTTQRPKPKARPIGEVVGTRAGTLVIDLGADQGLKRGDRIELYREVETELGAGEGTLREETFGRLMSKT